MTITDTDILINYGAYGVGTRVLELAGRAEEQCSGAYSKIRDIAAYNQLKVLDAFRKEKFSDVHMGQTTGYGYDDIGREKIENIFARVFGAEKAYVRLQISSGTQAIAALLWAVLRPGDEMLSVTGRPYDTLMSTIGIGSSANDMSLASYGISYKQVDLSDSGEIDLEAIKAAITEKTKMVFIQKSRGYTGRRALLCSDIKKIAECAKQVKPDVIVADRKSVV